MAALKEIKRRIGSAGNIRQITKALQLVAASELRRAQEAASGPQAYVSAADEMLSRLAAVPGLASGPLFEQRRVKRALTIVIAGDRGMAGAYNGNVFKAFSRHYLELGVPQDVISIGRRAGMFAAKSVGVTEIANYDIAQDNEDVTIAQPALEEAIELFQGGTVDTVHIIYTKFVTSIRQETTTEQLLPIIATAATASDITTEPEPEVLIEFVVNRVLEARVLQAILESKASEQAARMVAMLSATDNASDLITDLTLEYNNARQAAITQELAEITGGAEAINA